MKADAVNPGRPGARPAGARSGPTRPVIVAVHGALSERQIETHVRLGEARTIGRAPSADGLAGAVASTLDALDRHGLEVELRIEWVQTTATTATGMTTVAVGLRSPTGRFTRGMASGPNPMEAAARATVEACCPDVDPKPKTVYRPKATMIVATSESTKAPSIDSPSR